MDATLKQEIVSLIKEMQQSDSVEIGKLIFFHTRILFFLGSIFCSSKLFRIFLVETIYPCVLITLLFFLLDLKCRIHI